MFPCRVGTPCCPFLSPLGRPLAGARARALGAVSLNAVGQCVENLGLSAMVVAAPRGGPTKWCYSCRHGHFPSLHRLLQAGFGELGNVLLPAFTHLVVREGHAASAGSWSSVTFVVPGR